MNRYLLGLVLTAISIPGANAQDEFDDIYYNPKSSAKESKKDNKKSNYIANFSEMDVDDYNRRGFYYESEVDTIGQAVENAEDFVYTQQIQKYYNPTIVVDNADVLEDLLENSYGNVDIVIDNGCPTFTSIYTGSYCWAPVYYNWCYRPSWTWSYAWGPFSLSWNWGPAWAWTPAWGWDYYPGWGYGPSWGWGPSWGYYPPRPPHHGYPHHDPHHYAYGRPGAGRPYAPNAGWSNNTRPGVNYAGGGHSAGRPGASYSKPSSGTSSNRYAGTRRQQTSTAIDATPTRNNVRTSTSVRRNANNAQSATNAGSYNGSLSTSRNNGTAVKTNRTQTNTVSTKTSTVNAGKVNSGTAGGNRNSSNGSVNATTTNRTNSYNSSKSSTSNRSSNSRYTNSNSNSSRSYNSGSSRRSSGGGSYRSSGSSRGSGGGGHRGGRR